MNMEKKVGIWIDKRKAFIVSFLGEDYNTKELPSNIETFNPKGGARSKVAYGPMDKMNEKAYLKKEIRQTQLFFKQIEKEIGKPDHLFLFGPAQMKIELEKYLKRRMDYKPETMVTEPADSMTDNQMVAKVRDAFQLID